MTTTWSRVTRTEPCKVCNKSDWCTIAADGSACCMRVESTRPMKNGGWLHAVGRSPGQAFVARQQVVEQPAIDAASLIGHWLFTTTAEQVAALALLLHVAASSLTGLHAAMAVEHRAWAFPMYDGQGAIVGVRLRNMDGEKWAVKGSRTGIFIPTVCPQDVAFVCEGPTDTAAALTLGYFALGRPSCSSGIREVRSTCLRLGVRRVVVVSDNDAPGMRGAAKAVDEIGLPAKIYIPPTKDIRAGVAAGLTRAMVESSLRDQLWRMHGR